MLSNYLYLVFIQGVIHFAISFKFGLVDGPTPSGLHLRCVNFRPIAKICRLILVSST